MSSVSVGEAGMNQRTKHPKPVLLIHGVISDGSWQDEVGATLKPFFQLAQVRYPHYRGKFGAVKVVCEPWGIVLALAALVTLLALEMATWRAVATSAVIAFLACTAPVVYLRYRLALDLYKKEAGKVLDRRPHVIAHSFGTRLTAGLLGVVKGSRLGQVVLCGCVLPRSFDWSSLVSAGRVKAVRNDYSRDDWVGWGAKLAGRLHSHLGNAGTHGFDANAKGVHRLTSPDEQCRDCRSPESKASIHDVDCTGLNHNDCLKIASHCKVWWLPFLWGFDSAEHQELVTLCRDWVEADNDPERIAPLEETLHRRAWNWCQRKTLPDFLRAKLSDAGLPHGKVEVDQAFFQLAVKIEQASNAPLDDDIVQCLNPLTALAQVVEQAKEL
jgi:hypothetical protein